MMNEEDKFIREILANGIEEPSSDFTKNVMRKIVKEEVREEQKSGIPSLVVLMAIVFPLLAVLVSIKAVYKPINSFLKSLDLDGIVTQQGIIVICLGILFFTVLDMLLSKVFVKKESQGSPNVFSL